MGADVLVLSFKYLDEAIGDPLATLYDGRLLKDGHDAKGLRQEVLHGG